MYANHGHTQKYEIGTVKLSKQTKLLPVVSDKTLAQTKLAKDVHHNVHGGVVCNGKWTEIHDTTKLQRRRAVGWLWRCVFSEEDSGSADHTFLTLTSIFCQREMENKKPSHERPKIHMSPMITK